ncbi:3-coathanger stack domain-containing protein [Emticicia sp. C21]|uniref:3-coathanger stack domain-containing protein n=1 Tax=Emticicia sp. C21 TaxID=2302915 RepID=UPI000E35321F|nr:3-coathanger stack domain-containing protein [Emticicia sp. C21]RFS14398.1 hypothetical protein D0T08_21225 [Emticicia sp. C21]
MKNIYQPLYQRILLFCVLLLASQLTFGQQPPPPTVITTSQIVDYDEEITLQASCATGTLKWYEDVLATPALTLLTFNVTETKTYIAVCETSCGCGGSPLESDPVEILITVNTPTNVTTDKSICDGTSLELSALCPSGTVTWYEADETTLLVSTTVTPTDSPGPTSYFVSCVDGSYESPKQEVKIYVNNTPDLTIPSTTMTSPVEACLNSSITLDATCPSGTAVFYAGNSITEIDPDISNLSTIGENHYYVRCESITDCPSPFVDIQIDVSTPPTPTINTLADPVCPGSIVVLDATCDADSDPDWYLNDGVTPVINPGVMPDTTTTYKVRCVSRVLISCFSPFQDFTVTIKSDITSQPASVLACLGDNVTFTVGIAGTPTVIQWQKRQADGTYTDIPSATTETLTITNTTINDEGYYRLRVVGECDFFTEDAFLTFPETIIYKNKATPAGTLPTDGFGYVAAISNGFAIVGAPGRSMDFSFEAKGAAYIYKMGSDGKWSQTAQLTPLASDALQYGDYFGTSVAISGDYAFVGAPYKNFSKGVVFVFKKQANNSWTQVAKLSDPSSTGNEYFGENISASGDFLAVTQMGEDRVFIYKKDNTGTWTYDTDVEDPSPSPSNSFGMSIGISENTLAVGTPGFGINGAILVFERNNSGTWQFKDALPPSDPSSGIGLSTAISGNTILATRVSGSGFFVEVFEKNTLGTWKRKGELVGDGVDPVSGYGYSLSIHDNIAIVGAPLNFDYRGAAIVFEKSTTGEWVQKEMIMPDDLIEDDTFGSDVVTDGKNILITASPGGGSSGGPPPSISNKGAAYFYNLYTPPAVTVASVAQAAGVCSGQTATFNLTGLPVSDTFTITYKIDAGGTDKTVLVTSDASGKTSFTEGLTSADNTKIIYITKIKNEATGCEKVLDVNSTIAIKAPTLITEHPTPTGVCVGETAVFASEATGEGTLVFQWQRQAPITNGVNGPLTNDFADISVLTLPNRTSADNGATYRVKVTGECGVAISNDAILNVYQKAVVNITAGPPVCPGTAGSVLFSGTPSALVYYESEGNTRFIMLNADGLATVPTAPLTASTTFTLKSISIEGKCNRALSGSVVVQVLPTGTSIPSALVLVSPTDDVVVSDVKTLYAQNIQATNKINTGGKADNLANKYVLLEPGFEASQGSVFLAKISAACP